MDLSKKRKADENGGVYQTPATLIPDPNANVPPFPSHLSPDDINKILDPFTKDQLLPIIRSAVLRHPDVLDAVRSVADSDPAQRKLFVRGLGWETTTDKLRSVFSAFGELDEAIVITDKNSGKSKGYGFVTFKHIDAAILALKEPNKKIDGRITVTQLAAAGNSGNSQGADVALRKIYVGNIPFEITSERLLAHFSMYGEIDEGPLGFDKQTGKARGFAFFVYKTEEGARASLVDPMKTIDGHQVVCKLATDNKKVKQQHNVGPGGGVMGMPNAGAPGLHGETNYGVPGGGYGTYGGYSGGVGSGMQQQPGLVQTSHLNSGPGAYGNQGPGYGGGYGQVGSQYGASGGVPGGSGDYAGTGGLGNAAGASNLYRMPPSSVGMPSSGGYPESGNYGSGYPSQQGPGPRAPSGGGMYPGMPPYY